MKKKTIIVIVGLGILAGIYAGYNYARTTPKGTIKLYLASQGHIIDAIKANVEISNEKPWDGMYYCTNVSSGPDFYSLYQKDNSKRWYIDSDNTGGA